MHAVGRKEGTMSASEGAASTSTIAEMKEVCLFTDCDGSFAGFSLPVPHPASLLLAIVVEEKRAFGCVAFSGT